MGNVQASSIANQLLPFESYIVDIPEVKFVNKYLLETLNLSTFI